MKLPEENRFPSTKQLLECYSTVMGAWPNLKELHFIGLGLRRHLTAILKDLPNPLSKLTLHACNLSQEDIEQFLDTQHCGVELVDLGLQFNRLAGMAPEICEIILRSRLTKLDLRDSMLSFEEKIHIVSALGTATDLTALYLYDNEDMLTVAEYQHVIELACAVPKLAKFYIFPFNFKPFEILIRKQLEPRCQEVLSLNGRKDLILQY